MNYYEIRVRDLEDELEAVKKKLDYYQKTCLSEQWSEKYKEAESERDELKKELEANNQGAFAAVRTLRQKELVDADLAKAIEVLKCTQYIERSNDDFMTCSWCGVNKGDSCLSHCKLAALLPKPYPVTTWKELMEKVIDANDKNHGDGIFHHDIDLIVKEARRAIATERENK